LKQMLMLQRSIPDQGKTNRGQSIQHKFYQLPHSVNWVKQANGISGYFFILLF
jgi:hypothetical protein